MTDEFNVDLIIDLFNMVLKIAFFGAILLVASSIVKYKKSSNIKTEIQNLQARLSKLRLSLKSKVKKKSQIFRSSFTKTAITEGDMIDVALKELVENPFETSEQFQMYFDQSRKIVNFIQIETAAEPSQSTDLENNFMCSDFKTEMDIVRIIKEMSMISSRINSRVEDNNRSYPSQLLKRVDGMAFESLNEVNRIFKTDEPAEVAVQDDAEKKAS